MTPHRSRTPSKSQRSGISFIRRPTVRQRTGLSDSQCDVLEDRGEFPRRVLLSERAVGWVEAEVDRWCADRVAARDDQQPDSGSPPSPLQRRSSDHDAGPTENRWRDYLPPF